MCTTEWSIKWKVRLSCSSSSPVFVGSICHRFIVCLCVFTGCYHFSSLFWQIHCIRKEGQKGSLWCLHSIVFKHVHLVLDLSVYLSNFLIGSRGWLLPGHFPCHFIPVTNFKSVSIQRDVLGGFLSFPCITQVWFYICLHGYPHANIIPTATSIASILPFVIVNNTKSSFFSHM